MLPSPGQESRKPDQGAVPADSRARRQVVIHPVLFAFFPVFFLYAPNRAAFGFDITLQPAILSVSAVLLVWLGLRAAMGDFKRGALGASLVWLLVFAFQSLRDSVTQLSSGAGLAEIGPAHQIILGSVAAAIAAFVVCFKLRGNVDQATYLFNVIGTILVCMSLTDIMADRLFGPKSPPLFSGNAAGEAAINLPVEAKDLPDIYYLVLDGYGRADQLRRLYGFDNAEFLRFLEQRGFYVAPRAVANYPQTLLSIASSLNFDYLHEFLGASLTGVKDRRFVRGLLQENRAVRLLQNAGYDITAIASPYYEANVLEADTVVTDWRYPTVFEMALLDMTPLPWVLSTFGGASPYALHRSRILFSLAKLAEMPRHPGPKFVYCHILYAHPPFVFDEDGTPITPDRPYTWLDGEDYFRQQASSYDEYIDGYRGQVRFLNRRLQETLTAIIANSEKPPIILVQGDHGSGARTNLNSLERTDVEERYSILSAFYLPAGGNADLYESMSPVNSFRIIFNRYLGTSYPLLEDKLYYAPFERPYDFTLVDSEAVAKNASQTDGHGTTP